MAISHLAELENYLHSDVLMFYGPIDDGSESFILELIEQLVQDKNKKDILHILLTTTGGSSIAVERYVNIIRKHYNEVNFIVPDFAYSAGTIFCMSGDKILMDYYSVLGPIDPQVFTKDGKWVPALGYLDKISELIEKSKNQELSTAEFIILKEFDLAELRGYEQAKELTEDQLKKWLVKYKFKNWNTHSSDGRTVTIDEKVARAEEIATKLSDSNKWKSHGRPINIDILEEDIKLKVDDFGKDPKLSSLIREYHRLIVDYVRKNGFHFFFHTRCFI